MGAAFIYGATGTLSFYGVAILARQEQATVMFLAVGAIMLVIGLLFKVGAAPSTLGLLTSIKERRRRSPASWQQVPKQRHSLR